MYFGHFVTSNLEVLRTEETHMFYLILKDPMTQYLLRIEKSFCNDNFRIHFLLFFSNSRPHNDTAIVITLMVSINSRMGVSNFSGYGDPWTHLVVLHK
jgi:hypothetical protein